MVEFFGKIQGWELGKNFGKVWKREFGRAKSQTVEILAKSGNGRWAELKAKRWKCW